MSWIIGHSGVVLGSLLTISEGVAAVTQVLCPGNKGVNGILASFIKVLQSLGAQK